MKTKIENRISLITLGVLNLERAISFYTKLGLKRYESITEGVAFFQLNGLILSLFPREELAKDATLPCDDTPNFTGIALAYNTREEAEVDKVLSLAKEAGGNIVKSAQKVFWGGYSGYFKDTEGHLWEVAYNPSFPIDTHGNTYLPDEK